MRGDDWRQGSSSQHTHCAALCGPVVAALPASPQERCRWPSAADFAIPVELQSGSPSCRRDPGQIRRLDNGEPSLVQDLWK
jgi:hypothetical protein